MTTPETNTKTPTWYETARRFYARGFEVQTGDALTSSNADWAELPEHERSFTLAHLLYLNLAAQRGTQRMLAEVRDLLDDIEAVMGDDEDDDDPEPTPVANEAPAPIEPEVIVPDEPDAEGAA